MTTLKELRTKIRGSHLQDETEIIKSLSETFGLSMQQRQAIQRRALSLVSQIRSNAKGNMIELFLVEYGLSSDEGLALMCLAEALLRIPDATTLNDLIEDKIFSADWIAHIGQSRSMQINAVTWGLLVSGKMLQKPNPEALTAILRQTINRLSKPVIRTAIKHAIKIMGHQFVLGETIEQAQQRAKSGEAKGYTYSYDMLGEAALTAKDARIFYNLYAEAIAFLASCASGKTVRDNPGISVKLSALHPRYELIQASRVMAELVPRVKELAIKAKHANIGLNIDAEEANRLDLSLDIFKAVLQDTELSGWDGLGIVVQAYGKRAAPVIDWLYRLAHDLDRKIMVRLVKGAYWDTEIKQAQILGLSDYPVFTSKVATDVSYICCAQKLLNYSDRIYPQFATHNAHTIATLLEMVNAHHVFEFQRLHGMGAGLYDMVLSQESARCRIYAPVGTHRELLAYLVRRLLENGANSSFVNQLMDVHILPEEIVADPFFQLEQGIVPVIPKPAYLYSPERINSIGWDLHNQWDLDRLNHERAAYEKKQWLAKPLIHGSEAKGSPEKLNNPANPGQSVGCVICVTQDEAEIALQNAISWHECTATKRAEILNHAADIYEDNASLLFSVLCREAGKTAQDAVDELREAVDFLRFYAVEGVRLAHMPQRGLISCISPWNFPLAIFTGQIAAALAAGNGVLAKPANPTPITAYVATTFMHQAGVPTNVLQLLPGDGATIGTKLTTDPRINGICFTGSTTVAQTINHTAAKHLSPGASFIAETGGINAMIVDSTALPEQAIRDIVDGAFRSAGQRCSALRVLYLQEEIADKFLTMLFGAMDELRLGNPWDCDIDVGPVITPQAQKTIQGYINSAQASGRLLKQIAAPKNGNFIGPAVLKINEISELEQEIFGPVLHVATFRAAELDEVINAINDSQYGLTFGLHTRIDSRVEYVSKQLQVGNIYVNRNQIGAVVESQPFGGEGLSGTGPKAGGPKYSKRFKQMPELNHDVNVAYTITEDMLQSALLDMDEVNNCEIETRIMRGPTGELNRWSAYPKGTVICLGPTVEDARQQMAIAKENGCSCLGIAPGLRGEGTLDGMLFPESLIKCMKFNLVVCWGASKITRPYRLALSKRKGPILALVTTADMADFCLNERHLCVDTTAVGGNPQLMTDVLRSEF